MERIICTALFLFTIASGAFAGHDKIETQGPVNLKSGKKNDAREYIGKIEKKLPYSIDLVKKSVTNFTEKCNNKYNHQRKFTPSTFKCKHHNENIIETFKVNEFKKNPELSKFTETYILGRRIYNRSSYNYYELVTIEEVLDANKLRKITIIARMLSDNEIKNYIRPKFNKESVFDKSKNVFVLTEISPEQTKFEYEYSASTTHWVLNKEVSIPQVFSSLSRSIKDLLKSVEDEALLQKKIAKSKL